MSTLPFDQERRRRQQRRGVIEAGTGRPATFREFAEGAKEAIDQQVGQETQVESPQRFADFLSSTQEGQEAISTDMQIAQAEQQLAKLGQSTLTPGIAADAGPQQRLQALQQRVERASGPQAQQLQEFQREARSGPLGPVPEIAQATAMAAETPATIAGLSAEAAARTPIGQRITGEIGRGTASLLPFVSSLPGPIRDPILTGAENVGQATLPFLAGLVGGGATAARLSRPGVINEFGRTVLPGNVRTGRSIEPGATGAVTDAAGQAARATGRAAQQAPEQIQRQTDRLRPTSRAFAAGEDIDQTRQPVQRGFEGVQPDQPRADPEAARETLSEQAQEIVQIPESGALPERISAPDIPSIRQSLQGLENDVDRVAQAITPDAPSPPASTVNQAEQNLGEALDVDWKVSPTRAARQRKPPESRDPRTAASRIDRATEQIEAEVARRRLQGAGGRGGRGGGRIPPRDTGEPFGSGNGQPPPPRRPDVGLSDDLEIPLHEKPKSGVMRKWEGARGAESLAMEEWFQNGQRTLSRVKIQPSAETMRPLFEALHGERAPSSLPGSLRLIYQDVRRLVRQEEQDMMDFLSAVQDEGSRTLASFDAENFANRMMAHPDYFPRGWQPPESIARQAGAQRGRMGGTPSFAKPRREATFSEMLDEGWQPASWNPYAMMAQRRIAGVQYRENVKLVNRLKQRGLALRADEAPEEGWRVPSVGPVFEGRPIPDAQVQGGTAFTPQIAVPTDVADFLESAFGRVPDFPGLKGIRQWSNAVKRFKLAASLFQHADFWFRAGGTAFSPSAIRAGAPFKFPSLSGRFINLQVNPGSRNALRRQILSDKPLYDDFGITNRMLLEEGWNVQGDFSLIRREFDNFMQSPEVRRGLGQRQIDSVRKVQQFFESGLFDGIYRETQRWALENFIIPSIRRQRPDATPRQVAAEAADAVNVMFSTLGRWQTILKNPALREAAHNLMFSANESEGLLRSALRAANPRSPGGRMFREWYLGLFIFMAGVANAVNFAATGKPLPADAYNPLNINDPYAPFKVGYNSGFLSPQVPGIRGRNDTPVFMDVVGQMDTAFRWALDPVGAASARVNVIPRAVINQAKGETFFGEPLDSPGRRAAQLAFDVGAPIGPQNALTALTESTDSFQGVLPGGERRLGVTGNIAQASGINLRSEPTRDLLDRATQQAGFSTAQGEPVREYDQLEPFQKDDIRELQPLRRELEQRGETAALRGSDASQTFQRLDELEQERLADERRLLEAVRRGRMTPREFRNEYFDLQTFYRGAREERGVDFEDQPNEDADSQNKQAFQEYIDILDSDEIVTQRQRDIALQRWENKWAQISGGEPLRYVLRNTNTREHPQGIERFLPASTLQRMQRSEQARQEFRQRTGGRRPQQSSGSAIGTVRRNPLEAVGGR